ncbi:hypothetical protein ACLOJK_024827 [Asimina triloba]
MAGWIPVLNNIQELVDWFTRGIFTHMVSFEVFEMTSTLWRMYADHLYHKWEKTVLWDMIEPYRRPKSFTPLVSIYVAAFYTGVIGSAITEQRYKERYWEEHPGEAAPLMKPKFYYGPWRVQQGDFEKRAGKLVGGDSSFDLQFTGWFVIDFGQDQKLTGAGANNMIDRSKRICTITGQGNKNHHNGGLGEDLTLEIFSRVPPQSLLKFSFVSKTWNMLISELVPSGSMYGFLYFANLSKQQVGYSCFVHDMRTCKNKHCSEVSQSCNVLAGDLNFKPIAYCNGVFLFCKKGVNLADYRIYNPATMNFFAIPKPTHPVYCTDNSALACDPPHFRVAHCSILCRRRGNIVKVCLFSSETWQWRSIEQRLEPDHESLYRWIHAGAYVNGTLYFIYTVNELIRFDIEEVSIELVRLPRRSGGNCVELCIGECKGPLHYAGVSDFLFEVWMLNEPNSQKWSLKSRVRLETLLRQPAETVRAYSPQNFAYQKAFYPLSFHPELNMVIVGSYTTIFSYHFGSKTLKTLKEVCKINDGAARTRTPSATNYDVHSPSWGDGRAAHLPSAMEAAAIGHPPS